ncbi:E2.7.4.8 [Lepeophtheirus salmonis]|uniref:E2.7.4.8 n=1 Tax=Lepeophtheirus salmonis TaxID=72036 RepID=A0A7R8GZB3_LEPSM|nr:E2.7.4.8 [Lepeophtheirus salmonis]CAF2762778.1 E2.7.4.8 [Lepeophtheirus salmonis]
MTRKDFYFFFEDKCSQHLLHWFYAVLRALVNLHSSRNSWKNTLTYLVFPYPIRQGNQELEKKNGVEYNFSTKEDMRQLREDQELIEMSEYSGNLYGTSKKSIKKVTDTGRICLLDVDIKGVESLKASDINCKFVFIRPPSLEILEERLRKRGTEDEADIQSRLDNVREEIEYGDHEENFDKIIVNDDLNSAYQNLKSFIGQYVTTHFD